MRTWLTAREVSVMLGGISQPRVSQLVKTGDLIVERDSKGYYKYDRVAAEKLAARRAVRHAYDRPDAEERKALQAEARDRFRRQREREEQEELARQKRLDELQERQVAALEGIYECLRRR